MIYFVLHRSTNSVYIGKSNSARRIKWYLKEYNRHPDNEFIMMGSFEGTNRDLQSIYDSFKDLHDRGKWYKMDDLLEGTIASLTNH